MSALLLAVAAPLVLLGLAAVVGALHRHPRAALRVRPPQHPREPGDLTVTLPDDERPARPARPTPERVGALRS